MANQRKDNAAGKRSPMSFNQQCQARVQQVALAGATQPGCSCYKLSKIVKKFWVLLRKLRLRIRSLRIDKPHWRLLCQKHRQFTSTASQSGTGFFGSFLRDRHPAKCTPGEHKKKFAGDRSAHPWAPLLDSFFYTDSIRSDVDTFKLLYGLRPHQISLLCKSRHNITLARCGFGR